MPPTSRPSDTKPPKPFLSCLCPTYKRPSLLANALACFHAQDYPENRCELIIWDDAKQFDTAKRGNVTLISMSHRFPNLPEKFNALAEHAQGDVLVVWEDDDVFLPHHLSAIAASYTGGKQFFAPTHVYSNYGTPKDGTLNIERATGRFHSSWAYTRPLFDALGGYRQTSQLTFDQQMGSACRSACGETHYGNPEHPSYVYRWGNGHWHGSQAGDAGYQSLWDRLGSLPAPFIGELVPQMDRETQAIYSSLCRSASTHSNSRQHSITESVSR